MSMKRCYMVSKGISKAFSTYWACKKSDLYEVAEVKFWVGECPFELITFLLDVLKNDFVEVDEEIFRGVERPYELIFCILGIEKTTWVKSFQWCFK
jgi:hypothetical protein